MSKQCLIFEVYKGNSNLQLNDSQAGVPEGMMRVTGVAAVIGVKNRNNRVYNEENYLHHIKLLQDDIAYGLFGELEHPAEFTINLNNISHKVEAVWYEPSTKRVMITLLLLDTPKGKIAQSLIKAGAPVRVSSRAMGSVNKNHEAIISKLVTFDIVGTPGFKETELYLSESMTRIHESSLCESFFMEVPDEDLNECLKVTYDGDIASVLNNIKNRNMKRTNNLSLLESKLASMQNSNSARNLTINDIPTIAKGMTRFLNEEWAPVMVQWVADTLFPMYESYKSRKAINESLGKSACSFGAYYAMQHAEATRLFEAANPANGTIVLTQQEQEVLQKCMNQQQLTQEEQEIAQQAQEKLVQQQQQIKEALNPLNGTIVLTESEQQILDKLAQGEQLTQEELQQAQQAIQKQQKMQQQQQQMSQQQQQQQMSQQQQGQQQQMSQQQQGQQQVNQQQQEKQQELRESLNEKQTLLNSAYRRLLEAETPQQEQEVNEEIDQLKQDCDDIQQQLNAISEQQGQQQSKQFQSCQQKIQQGQELTEDDMDGLTQDEIQQLIQQQKEQQQQNESASDYDDPEDAKVFEQAQLTQEEQQVVKKQQKGQQLTQEEQQILKQAQQKLDQQQLPENDEQVNESLFGKAVRTTVNKSGSLLENLQQRMGMALDGKN